MLGFHDPGTDGLTSHPMKTGSYAMVLVRSIWGCVLMAALIALSPQVLALESLNVYTSIKDSLVGELKAAFAKKHPDINIDIQSAGAGKLMAKIAAERAGGEIQADVLWTSEVADFYQLKAAGLLYPYVPVEAAQLINPLPDYDGSFTPVRLGTLGIAYNTTLIARPPRSWDDLLKPEFRNVFGIANPELSGTAYMSVAVLSEKLGWRYFEKLRANGGRIGKGSSQIVEDTASGALSACLASPPAMSAKNSKASSSITASYEPMPFSLSYTALLRRDLMSSMVRGSSSKITEREIKAPFTSK